MSGGKFRDFRQKGGSWHRCAWPCMMAEMPRSYSGERSGDLDLAAITFLVRAVAPALLMAGLLLRFGALCPDDVIRGETASAQGVRAETSHAHHEDADHGGEHDCHHQPCHARFVALTASAPLLLLAFRPLLSHVSRRQDRAVAVVVRSAPRAPPERNIIFCVQLI